MTLTNDQTGNAARVDLTNCDREPIHLLGKVQSYGCLIATSSDMMINHMSANCREILGIDPAEAVGTRLEDFFPSATVSELRSKLQIGSIGAGVSRLFGYDVMGNGQHFDVSIHLSDQTFVFEFEPKELLPKRDDLALVQPLIGRVKRGETAMDAVEEAAAALQMMTGFDRVMVYRFAEDQSGEVIAERRAVEMEPYLGLRYPASDIPKQARELYLRSPLRLIADVDGEVSPIVPERTPSGQPLDLSLASTRAVSPIHLEYLRNMDVAASMSVSIVKDGKLWGLFACHHRTPHYIDFERRSAVELFAQFFSYELERKLEAEIRANERTTRELHDRLMIRLSSNSDMIDSFEAVAEELASIVRNDGIAIYSEGRFVARGSTPNEEEFRRLARFLNTTPPGRVYATNNLLAVYEHADTFADRAAGLIAIPISRTPRDYIVFFRREILQSVRWAGNPDKPVEVGPNGVRLTPRKSFDAWTELVRNTCDPWTEIELRAGEALRISLIEIVLKLSDEANAQRKKAQEKQELLIAELNHRVRNILNLIKGLVSQSRDGISDITVFAETLDGRLQALARAHDQLTSKEWSPTPLKDLIAVEAKAYLNGQSDRLILTGDAPLLAPEAFSTMALVIHELVTNAAKYGAFTDRSGKVKIDLRIEDDGALMLKWREIGGPPVQAPKRQGFGTTIVEKTVPFELNGKVDVRFAPAGLEVDIMIPSPMVSRATDAPAELAIAPDPVRLPMEASISGEVLVLEDNMVIALDASDILKDFGASKVHLASNVDSALALLDEKDIQFALLDVNLKDQTSLPVAEALAERGISFIFATGYGDVGSVLKDFPPAPVVTKPYTAESLYMQMKRHLGEES